MSRARSAWWGTTAQPTQVSAEELRAHLQEQLPQYMVPAAYVLLASLPLTPNGKVDRKALPSPEGDAYAHRQYEAPQEYLEVLLAEMWSDLLHVDGIGRHDDFFALGGHSLLAVQLVSRLHRRLSVEVSVWKVIQYPTIARLAMHLFDFVGENSGVLGFRTTGDDTPLFFTHLATGDVSYGAGIAHELDPQIPVYGLSVRDPAEVGGSIERLADHHIRSMRRIQPHGPYRVAGWSFGGFVAYEIARQLIGQDETVEFLGILDTPVRAARKQARDVAGSDVCGGGVAQCDSAVLPTAHTCDRDVLLRQRCRQRSDQGLVFATGKQRACPQGYRRPPGNDDAVRSRTRARDIGWDPGVGVHE